MRGNPDARQGAIALHGFYFLYYGLQGVSIPFLPLWFASRGLDPALIGLIVATSFCPRSCRRRWWRTWPTSAAARTG
ncbi:MFS transporter [Achromobacter insuavis]